MPIAPSTYYAARTAGQQHLTRVQRDEHLKGEVRRVHADNFGVYGARKIWLALRGPEVVGQVVVGVQVSDEHGRGAVNGVRLGEHPRVDHERHSVVLDPDAGVAELRDAHAVEPRLRSGLYRTV